MGDDDQEQRVPLSRLQRETEKLREAQARVGELEGLLAAEKKQIKALESKAASSDGLLERNAELEKAI